MYKVSVIIPVYNAENTLKDTINSVINQTIGFENIELIIIDDNSTDDSKSIITDFANKYKNIKAILLKENTGSPVMPRNIGIQKTTSKYLMFLDSDDLITSDCLDTLVNIAKKENAELIQCIYVRKIQNHHYVYNHVDKRDSNYHLVSDVLKLRGTVWGNLFKTSLIQNNIYFYDVLHEDAVFFLESSLKANKVLELPNFYGYIYNLENNESVTHNISTASIEKYLKGFELQNNILEKNNIFKEECFNNNIPMIYFMFFKFKGEWDEKIQLLKKIHNFEISLNYPIKLRSKPLNILNNIVLNEKYHLAVFLCNFISILYYNNIIRNLIFKKYSNIKKIELK